MHKSDGCMHGVAAGWHARAGCNATKPTQPPNKQPQSINQPPCPTTRVPLRQRPPKPTCCETCCGSCSCWRCGVHGRLGSCCDSCCGSCCGSVIDCGWVSAASRSRGPGPRRGSGRLGRTHPRRPAHHPRSRLRLHIHPRRSRRRSHHLRGRRHTRRCPVPAHAARRGGKKGESIVSASVAKEVRSTRCV